jgi:chorismate-pyruvate lyase
LDSLFDAFRRPFVDYARAVDRVEKLKDTLTAIKRKLDSLPRGSGEYRDLYLRFGDRAESLAAVQRNEAQARDALDRTRRALGKRMDSLRAGVSRWEDTTFRGYDSIVTQLQRIRGRSAIQDSTRADGRTRLFLKGGPWWIYARSWDVMDPNREWYWNIPVEGDSVILDRRSGRHRTRY